VANVTPAGLFAFAMMAGLETTYLLESLVLGTVTDAFLLTWGPYMFFSSGLVQILVALVQVARNNVYGAAAFIVVVWHVDHLQALFGHTRDVYVYGTHK
jgi:succinate-acetate transporter protein